MHKRPISARKTEREKDRNRVIGKNTEKQKGKDIMTEQQKDKDRKTERDKVTERQIGKET